MLNSCIKATCAVGSCAEVSLLLSVPVYSILCLQNGTNGLNGMSAGMNGLNGLNAAALALQALAAANPALLLSQNPWLASQMQLLGGMPGVAGAQTSAGPQLAHNPFGANMGAAQQQQGNMPVMDAAQFAAAQQLAAGQHLNGTAGEEGLCQAAVNLLSWSLSGVMYSMACVHLMHACLPLLVLQLTNKCLWC